MHPEEVGQMAEFVPKPIWVVSHTLNETAAGFNNLQAIANKCKKRQLATYALGEMMEDEEIGKIDPKDTVLDDISVDRSSTEITFSFRRLPPKESWWSIHKDIMLFGVGGAISIILVWVLATIGHVIYKMQKATTPGEENIEIQSRKSNRSED